MNPEPRTIVVLDGYNVMHRDPDFRSALADELSAARQRLIRKCAEWLAMHRNVAELYVVFDGNSSVSGTRREAVDQVRVVYTETGESADDWILSFVRRAGDASDYVVVSDDNKVSGNSRGLGAETMRVAEFCGALDKRQAGKKSELGPTKAPLSPNAEREINEAVKKAWGLE